MGRLARSYHEYTEWNRHHLCISVRKEIYWQARRWLRKAMRAQLRGQVQLATGYDWMAIELESPFFLTTGEMLHNQRMSYGRQRHIYTYVYTYIYIEREREREIICKGKNTLLRKKN